MFSFLKSTSTPAGGVVDVESSRSSSRTNAHKHKHTHNLVRRLRRCSRRTFKQAIDDALGFGDGGGYLSGVSIRAVFFCVFLCVFAATLLVEHLAGGGGAAASQTAETGSVVQTLPGGLRPSQSVVVPSFVVPSYAANEDGRSATFRSGIVYGANIYANAIKQDRNQERLQEQRRQTEAEREKQAQAMVFKEKAAEMEMERTIHGYNLEIAAFTQQQVVQREHREASHRAVLEAEQEQLQKELLLVEGQLKRKHEEGAVLEAETKMKEKRETDLKAELRAKLKTELKEHLKVERESRLLIEGQLKDKARLQAYGRANINVEDQAQLLLVQRHQPQDMLTQWQPRSSSGEIISSADMGSIQAEIDRLTADIEQIYPRKV